MSQPKMKIGMIGVGGFGGYRRARMRETGLFELVACVDRNAAALESALREDGARAVESVDQLVATPGLEGIVISTGVDSHVPLAVKAMDAGLHVFVEKPLCGKAEEIEIIRAARARLGKVVGLGHSHNPTNPMVMSIQKVLDEGTLGTLVCYEENSSHSGGLEIQPGDWRGLRDRNPGGMLLQCGVHSLHTLLHLFGPLSQVSCMLRYDANPNTQTADAANVILRHASGLVGTLNCYHVTAYCHELRLFGTKANLYIDTHTRSAHIQYRKRGPIEPREPFEMPFTADNGHSHANVINWYRAIRDGVEPDPSLEHGIAAVAPVFAAERSDETGQTVTLESAGEPARVA